MESLNIPLGKALTVMAIMALSSPALSSAAWAQLQMTIKPSLPGLPSDDKAEEAIYCRPPLPQSDSRLPGPKTCLPQREWDRLHAEGLDVGADGKSSVASEKYRTLRGP
jgi:hypothetical protein